MRFENEEVKAVALGTGWVAAVTSAQFLRIFTAGGLQVGLQNTKLILLNYIFMFHLVSVNKQHKTLRFPDV